MKSKAAVGYGRPPAKYQFKPGQSGNPAGRRKKNTHYLSLLADVLQESIKITDQYGRHVRMTKLEAILTRVMNDALQGDAKAHGIYLWLMEQYGPPPEKPKPARVRQEIWEDGVFQRVLE